MLGRDFVTIGPDLQEAEEEGVDGHLVDGEEGGGDQVGGHRDQQGRQEREVELGQLLSHLLLIGDIEGQRRNRRWCHFKKETFCQKKKKHDSVAQEDINSMEQVCHVIKGRLDHSYTTCTHIFYTFSISS